MNKAWLIVPAAGMGQRMASCVPKQYMKIMGKTVIEHSLAVFEHFNNFKKIIIVLAKNDIYWQRLKLNSSIPIECVTGGKQRYDSVINALTYLKEYAADDDWVFVHDAARPCLQKSDVALLFSELEANPVGGILATPVKDTLKLSNADLESEKTVNRNNLWQALTPQVFRFKVLYKAMLAAKKYPHKITDEASAVECYGLKPKLVQGQSDNFKITLAEDIELAKLILKSRNLPQEQIE